MPFHNFCSTLPSPGFKPLRKRCTILQLHAMECNFVHSFAIACNSIQLRIVAVIARGHGFFRILFQLEPFKIWC